MQTVLAKVVTDKVTWVETRRRQQPLASFQNEVVPTQRNFYDALAGTRTAFILECEKASSSKGLVREDLDPATIASVYKHYTPAVSVLCDGKYLQDSFDFLPIVSKAAPQPILCKDFTIDPYQIYLARYYQTDTCLLMLSVLDDGQYHQPSAAAHSLNMGVLTEVSSKRELERTIALKTKVVGTNNRGLRDMSIDLNRTRQLTAHLGPDVTVIDESGIHIYAEVHELSHFTNSFLIDSTLMGWADLEAAVKRVLLGENKVYGLTRPQNAQVAWEPGAIYGGLISVPALPRAMNDAQARTMIATVPLQCISMFRNTPLDEVIAHAQALGLTVVQLHGNGDQAYTDALRDVLTDNVRIWKVLNVGETLPTRTLRHVDKYPFDNGQGGSSQRFDQSLLQGQDLRNVMLAGGPGADNCAEMAKSGCTGLDFNSDVESQPGIKDAGKLASVFQTLCAY